ncbi:hypothetical protein ES702_05556 [subsurface metagenome]
MVRRKRLSESWCPVASMRIDSYEVCELCDISSVLCRVKRNLRLDIYV